MSNQTPQIHPKRGENPFNSATFAPARKLGPNKIPKFYDRAAPAVRPSATQKTAKAK